MTASPWAPPQNGGQQTTPAVPPGQSAPVGPQAGPPQAGHPVPPVSPPPRPPRRVFAWLIAGGVAVLLIAVIAATAAITYAVARSTNPTTESTPTPQAPQFSAAEQSAAKAELCRVFDMSARGQRGQGGMRIDGEVNVPLLVRTVNSAVAVQNALKPAVPQNLKDVAQRYIDTALELTTAATGNPPIGEVNRLTDVSNEATYAFADACGLQR